MTINYSNLVEQVTSIIPKGGAWITLQNIRLAFEIIFFISWEVIKLAIFIVGMYYLIQVLPPLETIKEFIYK